MCLTKYYIHFKLNYRLFLENNYPTYITVLNYSATLQRRLDQL